MLRNFSLQIYLIVGVVITLAIGSTFTPVIPRGSSSELTSREVANSIQEMSFCSANLEDVNCACFAGISGHILSQDTPSFRGSVSVDRFELARAQASEAC
jgi:hypothetical protein